MAEAEELAPLKTALGVVLKEALPDYQALTGLQRLTGGASRLMYRLTVDTTGGEQVFAFRQNPPEEAPSGMRIAMEDEAGLLRLAREAGVPVPGVICTLPHDHPANSGLGDGYVMEWIEGETLGGRIVRSGKFAAARPGMAAQCGDMLARIHQIDIEENGLAGKLRTLSAAEMIDGVYQQYLDLGQPHPMIDYAARWLRQNIPETDDYRLTHGDFRNGNLIVTEQGIAASLDWELAAISDPCRDLAWLCVNSWRFGQADLPVGGFGELDDLFAAYEKQAGQQVDRARFLFWQVYGSFWWGITCLVMGSAYTSGISKEADRPAIGRRSTEAQIDLVNLLIPGKVTLTEPAETDEETHGNAHELAESIGNTLNQNLVPVLQGRDKFLAMVLASNAAIIQRELEKGPAMLARQVRELQDILNSKNELNIPELRQTLCMALREGKISLENERLKSFLRQSVADQVAIDQPAYSGLKAVL